MTLALGKLNKNRKLLRAVINTLEFDFKKCSLYRI